jgi:transposase
MKHYVGIDLGEQEHQVCVMTAEERVISESRVAGNQQGLEELQRLLGPLGEVEINVERPNGPWVMGLVQAGYAVYVTAPKVVSARRPRRSKDDRGDAFLLATLRCRNDGDSRRLELVSAAGAELAQWVRSYEHLQQQQRRLGSQLRSVLVEYYPVMLGLFSTLTQPLTLAFLTAYPNPQAAQAASLTELERFFRSQRYRYLTRVPALYRRLQQPMLIPLNYAGNQAYMLALVASLRMLAQQVHEVEGNAQRCFAAHPQAAWWRSWPGAGRLTAMRLLAYLGDNPQRWPSYQVLQAHAGTVPVTRRSGKKVGVEFRMACCRPLRRTVIQLARNSTQSSGWARSYFHDQLARGHTPSRAYRALANRWLKILWTVWHRGDTYNEALHVANRSRQGLPTLAIDEP